MFLQACIYIGSLFYDSQVFDDPDASDPSHSLLSKAGIFSLSFSTGLKLLQDHFALILNEPAGKTALVVVRYAVGLIVNVSARRFFESISILYANEAL
jgi:hypothetical protein